VQSTFSPSSLSCFENCPKQYHFRYVEPLDVDREGIEAFVGKRVHEVLERLYRFVAEGLVPSRAKVLWRYQQNFEAQFDPARVRIVREGTEVGWYLDVLVRPYPARIAGTPEHIGYDPATRTLEVVFRDRVGTTGPTEIVVPARVYPEDPVVDVPSDPPGSWRATAVLGRPIVLLETTASDAPHRVVVRPRGP